MKKRKNNYDGKTRLIRCSGERSYYLCIFEEGKWVATGTRKSIRDLYPLIDGNRYHFFVSRETKRVLLEASPSNKFSLLVRKLSVVD